MLARLLARRSSRRLVAVLDPTASAAQRLQLLLAAPAFSTSGRRAGRRGRSAFAAADDEGEMTIIDVDFGRPPSWYPAARRLKRSLILHTGPTNSGKTFEALERLRGAQNGVYCGPLRLLAWEVFEKLNASGVELTEVEGARHTSCTVEMVDVNRTYDVAVVDECQLIGDSERGHAWTRAILGLPAVELHLCGSPAFLGLIQRLARQTGDSVEVRRYERLSPLKTARRPVKDWGQDIKPGDCVVAFSRRKLFQLKSEIEIATAQRVRCCVVYGALPPEARREQARLFNDERSGFDVLVASDAVGLGLNLNIARIVFHSLEKFDGKIDRRLEPAEIKQIAGRAGRFQSRFEEGVVSARSRGDLALIAHALKAEDDPVKAAGVAPTREQLQLFAKVNGLRLRETEEDYQLALEAKRRARRARGASASSLAAVAPDGRTYIEFARLLQFFQRAAKLGGATEGRGRGRRDPFNDEDEEADEDEDEDEDEEGSDLYFLVEMDDMISIARLIEEIPMSLADRFTWCLAPVDTAKRELMAHLRHQALQFFRDGAVRLDVNILSEKIPVTAQQLAHLEEVHAICDVYLWLGQRFGADVFVEMEEAARAAELCSELIDEGLQVMRPKGMGKGDGGGGGGSGRRARGGGGGGGGGGERGRFPKGTRRSGGRSRRR